MTLKEFKAWFEGFTEDMEMAPTAKQWARIKERVGEIDGAPVTERVFIERYWPHKPQYFQGVGSITLARVASAYRAQIDYQSTQAMYAAGKADMIAMDNT